MQAERMTRTLETVLVTLRSCRRRSPGYYHETESPGDRTRSGRSVDHPDKMVSVPGSRSLEGWVREYSGRRVADADGLIERLHIALGCGSVYRPQKLTLEHAIRACEHVKLVLQNEARNVRHAQLVGGVVSAMMDIADALEGAGCEADAYRATVQYPDREGFLTEAAAASVTARGHAWDALHRRAATGQDHAGLGQIAHAIEAIELAISHHGHHDEAWRWLGEVTYRIGRAREAA